jgi:hypothetical protein
VEIPIFRTLALPFGIAYSGAERQQHKQGSDHDGLIGME